LVKKERPSNSKQPAKKAPAAKVPEWKLLPPEPGEVGYSDKRAAADWAMMEARMEARGIPTGLY
jgi:hypothetical protein